MMCPQFSMRWPVRSSAMGRNCRPARGADRAARVYYRLTAPGLSLETPLAALRD